MPRSSGPAASAINEQEYPMSIDRLAQTHDRAGIAWDMEATDLAEGTLKRRIIAPTEETAIEEMEIWLAETGCRHVDEVIAMRAESEGASDTPEP